MADRVLVIGGGLAGLAATTALASAGFQCTLLDSRGRLGGRASSFRDPQSGQLIDACQHVSMGCCTNFSHFCRTVGSAEMLEKQTCLYFMTPDRRISKFASDRLPAPFHLSRSFAQLHYLGWREKALIAYGLVCLRMAASSDDRPFRAWLAKHHQTERIVNLFWGVVLTSALNETPGRIGLRYARKVFVDGFMSDPRGFDIYLPKVPLGEIYGQRLRAWMDRHSVDIRLNTAARTVRIEGDHVMAVDTRQGQQLHADWYVLAIPFERLNDVLSGANLAKHRCFDGIGRLESSPITSVHLWYSSPVLDLPHVVLVDGVGQWVFNRGKNSAGEYYIQVVISASRLLREVGNEAARELVCTEMERLFPAALRSRIRRSRVITEQSATFSALPGVDRWRPKQVTSLSNLFLAGDWTETGWPATMEGAVRSGYLVAEALIRQKGRRLRFVQPDLA